MSVRCNICKKEYTRTKWLRKHTRRYGMLIGGKWTHGMSASLFDFIEENGNE